MADTMTSMTTPTELEARLETMPAPVKHQGLIDKLTALVLLGKVDFYAAKFAVEDSDWKRARELIAEGTREGEETK